MGKALRGGATHSGNVSMLLPEQQQALSQILGDTSSLAGQTFANFLGPQDPQQLQDVFQKSYVDPAMMTFQRNIVPGIQERFEGANASSSSALTQALSQSASDLSTSLGSQFGQLKQQEDMKSLRALGLLQPYVTGQTFSPMIQQRQGILGSMLGAAGNIGAGILSSKKAKENIRPYEKGMDELRKMDVKQYDYIKEVGGHKDRVGLIAEELPKEVTMEKDDYLHVDLYGVMGMMINAIKELESRIENLEVD